MSYGKLTIHMGVLDSNFGDDYDTVRNSTRWVGLLTCHTVTQEEATQYAKHFVSLNIAKDQRNRLRVIWQEHPVEIDVE